MANLVTIQAHQRVNLLVDGREIHLKPGDQAKAPYEQASELQRAGLVFIVQKFNGALPGAASTALVCEPALRPTPLPVSPSPSLPRHGTAALIVNYNMPERTDALVKHLKKYAGCELEIIVIDNGSDISKPPKNTTVRIEQNVQTTNGWLLGLHYLDALAAVRGYRPEFYWFLITSTEFVDSRDPLTQMVEFLVCEPNAAVIHPALSTDSQKGLAWKHMLTNGTGQPRQVWMVDNIASLWRAEYFDSIGRFDPALIYGWGIDLEACYRARRDGRGVWIDERVQVRKVTDIGYQMNRMNMSAEDRRAKAEANLSEVMQRKYGEQWRETLWNAYREPDALVSIVVPTYNRPETLKRTLDSIAAQTYRNFEAIVVNDGGEDVAGIVGQYPFARYFSHSGNRGLPAARNTALLNARGQYIAYLDDDDWYYPNHLRVLLDAIKGHRAAYSCAYAIDPDVERDEDRYVFNVPYNRERQLNQNLFPVNTVMHEKSLLDQAGYFDERLPRAEDWDMWLRIGAITDFAHVQTVTCAVDRTRPSMSSDRAAMHETSDQIRKHYAKAADCIRVAEREYAGYDINKTEWNEAHPAGISGCLRVRNDAEFLRGAVISHLPYLDEIVIALQPSEDDSEAICYQLANEYPRKVRVVRYPVAPVYLNDSEWATIPENSIRSFIHLSNWALSQCRYSWIAKFEADVICLSSFQKIIDAIKANPDRLTYYGRSILNVGGLDYRVINAQVPCNGGFDEAVFPNAYRWHFTREGKYETVNHGIGPYQAMGWSALHLKHAKARYWGKINEPFVPFDAENVKVVMTNWLKDHTWPAKDNPLGEPCLFADGWRKWLPERVTA